MATDWGAYDQLTAVSTGMVSYLAKGEVDIAVTPVADVPVRRQVLAYSYSVFKGSFSAFYLLPNVRASFMGLLEPFRGLIGFVIAVCFAAAACGSLVNRLVLKNRVVAEMDRQWIPNDCRVSYIESWSLVQAVGLLCSRSTSLTTKSGYSSENAVAFTLASTGFLLLSIYTAFNLAFLATRYDSFQTPEQLLAASYAFGFANSYPIVQYFAVKTNSNCTTVKLMVTGTRLFEL